MVNRDMMGEEIKKIMQEDTFDMTLSSAAVDNILKLRKKTIKEKINEFENREIEVPLVPGVALFLIVCAIGVVPRDILKVRMERTVNIGGSQIIFIEGRASGKNENENKD
ncbi:MAG TPA: hypothetical protein DEF04_10025 [Clostridiales bacterium]|nr:hypothetical protein [Clostridiales bacterium]